jgi:holo-ACP synthase CitX
MPVTLAELLDSRDKRVKHQKDLLGTYPGKSLLCLTVQLPGPEKRNATSLKIAKAGVEAVREAFVPVYEELKDLETGYEAYFLVNLPAEEAKRRACEIEDSHPLGRLMDIDVIHTVPPVSGNYFSGRDPKNQFPETSTNPTHINVGAVSRLDIGLEARRCLLCDNEVRYCMRAKTHSKEELLRRIEQMLKEYELQTPNPRTD